MQQRFGFLIAIVSAGMVSAGCGGQWTGPHWATGNRNAPFAESRETSQPQKTVEPREVAVESHPAPAALAEVHVQNDATAVTPVAPAEAVVTPAPAVTPAPIVTSTPAPAPSAATEHVVARNLVPVDQRQVKIAVHPGDVPEEVQGTFARDFPGADIKKVIKKTDGNGKVEYWYLFDDLKYHEHFATYAESGKKLWDKPAAAMKDFFKYDQRPPENRYTQGALD